MGWTERKQGRPNAKARTEWASGAERREGPENHTPSLAHVYSTGTVALSTRGVEARGKVCGNIYEHLQGSRSYNEELRGV